MVGADGIRSQVRGMIGIDAEPQTVGMGIWRVVADRPAEMECSELYYGGPKYKAGYTPISEDYCYAFLIEEILDRSFVGEKPNGKVLKEHGAGYGGTWGKVRDSIADDAVVNYQWIEAVQIDGPWHRGRVVLIGDAAHACPPLIAQGAAMSAEDGVVLAEVLETSASVEEALEAFMARRGPRVGMVLGNSLQLAEWEIHPETPGRRPRSDHGPDPPRALRTRLTRGRRHRAPRRPARPAPRPPLRGRPHQPGVQPADAGPVARCGAPGSRRARRRARRAPRPGAGLEGGGAVGWPQLGPVVHPGRGARPRPRGPHRHQLRRVDRGRQRGPGRARRGRARAVPRRAGAVLPRRALPHGRSRRLPAPGRAGLELPRLGLGGGVRRGGRRRHGRRRARPGRRHDHTPTSSGRPAAPDPASSAS